MITDERMQAYFDMMMEANFYTDEYVRLIFSGEERADRVKVILAPFIGREIEIRDVRVEFPIDSIGGRGIRMDVCAVDEDGSTFDVEFQRDQGGAHPHRARFNSAMIDAHYPLKGVGTNDLRLPETYVLFFTEQDYFKRGKAFYPVERMITNIDEPFDDGSHIIYINGKYDDTSTRAGRIIHDLRTARADDMLVPEIANWTRGLKETEEGKNMLSDEIARIKNDFYQEGRQEGLQEGIQQGKLTGLYDLVSSGDLPAEVASKKMDMPVSVFMEKMAEYNRAHA